MGHQLGRVLGKVGVAGAGRDGPGADEHEGRDPSGVVKREELGDPAADPEARDVRGRQAVGVQDASGVRDEIAKRVIWGLGVSGRGPSGVAQVVADDEPAQGPKACAQVVVPGEHRVAHQQDRRVSRVAERLDAQFHPVGLDEGLHDGLDCRNARNSSLVGPWGVLPRCPHPRLR